MYTEVMEKTVLVSCPLDVYLLPPLTIMSSHPTATAARCTYSSQARLDLGLLAEKSREPVIGAYIAGLHRILKTQAGARRIHTNRGNQICKAAYSSYGRRGNVSRHSRLVRSQPITRSDRSPSPPKQPLPNTGDSAGQEARIMDRLYPYERRHKPRTASGMRFGEKRGTTDTGRPVPSTSHLVRTATLPQAAAGVTNTRRRIGTAPGRSRTNTHPHCGVEPGDPEKRCLHSDGERLGNSFSRSRHRLAEGCDGVTGENKPPPSSRSSRAQRSPPPTSSSRPGWGGLGAFRVFRGKGICLMPKATSTPACHHTNQMGRGCVAKEPWGECEGEKFKDYRDRIGRGWGDMFLTKNHRRAERFSPPL